MTITSVCFNSYITINCKQLKNGKKDDKAGRVPYCFSLEMLIQDVVRPYQMAAFESVRFSYPVRIERALRVSGSQLMACKEAPLAGTNKVCQS